MNLPKINKKGNKKRKIVSAIANIFVKRNSKSGESKVQEAKVEVERDQTKSIFNFLWQNTFESLKETIIKL